MGDKTSRVSPSCGCRKREEGNKEGLQWLVERKTIRLSPFCELAGNKEISTCVWFNTNSEYPERVKGTKRIFLSVSPCCFQSFFGLVVHTLPWKWTLLRNWDKVCCLSTLNCFFAKLWNRTDTWYPSDTFFNNGDIRHFYRISAPLSPPSTLSSYPIT